MNFDIKALYNLIENDRMDKHLPDIEEDEYHELFGRIDGLLMDVQACNELSRLYAACKVKLCETSFIDGFRTAVALILDNGKGVAHGNG